MKKIALLTLIAIIALPIFAQAQYDLNETYIPYRKGKLWGLADTSGNIVVEPQYDRISYNYSYRTAYFKVWQDLKEGIITPNRVIIPCQHYDVSKKPNIIEAYDTSVQHKKLYNYDGVRLLDFDVSNYLNPPLEEYDNFYLIKASGATQWDYKLYYLNKATQKFHLVFPDVIRDVDDNKYVKGIIKIIFGNRSTKYYRIFNKDSEMIFEEVESQIFTELYNEAYNKAQLAKNSHDDIPRDFAKQKKEFRIEYKLLEGDIGIEQKISEATHKGNKNSKSTHFLNKGRLKYSLKSMHTTSFQTTDNLFWCKQYILSQELDENGEMIKQGFITNLTSVEPQFESVECYTGLFVVSKKVDDKILQGILFPDGTWALPLQSDFEITNNFFGRYNHIVIKKDDQLGLMCFKTFKIVIPIRYDEIKDKRNCIVTKKNNKYGCYIATQKYTKIVAAPILDLEPHDFKFFNNDYVVLILINKKSALIRDYVLPNGTLLYED